MKLSNTGASSFRSFMSTALSLVLIAGNLVQSVAMAQSTAQDVSPPVIELEEIPGGVMGQAQVFTALVADDGNIKDVKLYYRFMGAERFTDVPMTVLANTDYYTATVSTDQLIESSPGLSSAIEYYIQARDEGGNRVVKGFAFDPFIRKLEPPLETRPVVRATPEPAAAGGIKIWQVVLGVLAVGAIAGAASGGGSDRTTPAQQVPLTLTIDTP